MFELLEMNQDLASLPNGKLCIVRLCCFLLFHWKGSVFSLDEGIITVKAEMSGMKHCTNIVKQRRLISLN